MATRTYFDVSLEIGAKGVRGTRRRFRETTDDETGEVTEMLKGGRRLNRARLDPERQTRAQFAAKACEIIRETFGLDPGDLDPRTLDTDNKALRAILARLWQNAGGK